MKTLMQANGNRQIAMTDKVKKREDMARKIRALLAKSEDPAATEGEAMAASAKAKELLDKYQLDLGAIGLMEEGFDEVYASSRSRESARIHNLLSYQIGAFTDTMALVRGRGKGKPTEVSYFGLATDVIFAAWLAQSLEKFILRSSATYKSRGKRDYNSFRDGMAQGICRKIRQAIIDRKENIATSGGTELVELDKFKIVENEAHERWDIGAGRSAPKNKNINSDLYIEGIGKGGEASLNHPIERNEIPALLEGDQS